MNWEERLNFLGMLYPVALGIQIDLNSAWRNTGVGWIESSFCDHDCTTKHGGYNCPAAKSVNTGVNPKTMPALESLKASILAAIEGQRRFRDRFLAERFESHCDRFNIPAQVRPAYRKALESNKHEVNVFGGNPELNRASLPLIEWLLSEGIVVNFTTTGGQPMRSDEFRSQMIRHPPHRLALSADDLSPAEVDRLTSMPLSALREEHASTPHTHGQKRKAIEGVFGAKLAAETEGFPPVLFNMVIHQGNVHDAIEMVEHLERAFPHVLVNPYPAQSSMLHGEPTFRAEHVDALRKLVKYAIERTLGTSPFVRRLQYWLMLEAALQVGEGDSRSLGWFSGYGTWRCYQRDAAWYLQIGRYELPGMVPIHGLKADKRPPEQSPGNHAGCYWNAQTVTQPEQVQDGEQIQKFLEDDMRMLAVTSSNPCPGCIMPRLLFHEVSLTSGLHGSLVPKYLELRRHYVGF